MLNLCKNLAKEVPIKSSLTEQEKELLQTNNIVLLNLANDLDTRFRLA